MTVTDLLRNVAAYQRRDNGRLQLTVNGCDLEEIGSSCRRVFALDDDWVLKALPSYGEVTRNQSFDEWFNWHTHLAGTEFDMFAATPWFVAVRYTLAFGGRRSSPYVAISVQERMTSRYAPIPRDGERDSLLHLMMNECTWLSDTGMSQIMWDARACMYKCVDYGIMRAWCETNPGYVELAGAVDGMGIGENPLVIGGVDSGSSVVNEIENEPQMSTREMAI